ncbi:MAG TPA: HAD family hydrolase [Rhabdochlamydiaceae bacterium]|nr:HAD family hydrolase [Rhabdochlamydiaceae bacterium]
MLVIFDLDDTLIDTSGIITPFKLKLALMRMVEAGLKTDPFDRAFQLLKQIDSQSEATRHTINTFLDHYGAPKSFFDIAMQAFVEPLPEDFVVKTWRQTHQVLTDLKKDHTLAIVTMGDPDFQMEKIKKAGLEHSIFCKIAVAGVNNKKPHYKSLMEELKLPPTQVVVVGDRIGNDLTPAKELGALTVHLVKGRGKNSKGPKEHVDFTICEIEELTGVL